jgi:hypothetical protein
MAAMMPLGKSQAFQSESIGIRRGRFDSTAGGAGEGLRGMKIRLNKPIEMQQNQMLNEK